MSGTYVRANFFDASALVKIYVEEPGSAQVREYFNNEPTKYTTTFCFYETLNILKAKWKSQGRISKQEYLNAAFRLIAWFGHTAEWVRNLEITEASVLKLAQDLASRHDLDMSDALQLITVQQGYFSSFGEESKTIFVTADKKLARVARDEGLRVWSVLEESPPN